MSILNKSGERSSVTEGWRALELFTDRLKPTRLFATYLNADPSPEQILFFHGDGGNGKSLLLRYLSDRCAKRLSPENWKWISAMSDEDLKSHIESAEGAEQVPSAHLDFGAQPRGEDRPQESFSALLMLRRSLGEQGFGFPLFDFACITYLMKTGALTGEKLKSLFPADDADFTADLVELVTNISWVAESAQLLFRIFEKRLGKSFALYKAKRKLDPQAVLEIGRLDIRRELPDELPHLFARDLNTAMAMPKSPSRVVLFFDTHEAFWGERRELSSDLYFEKDEWLRRLLGELHLSSGIVAVVAGREPPRWAEATRIPIPEEFIDIHLLGHLPSDDALQYLEAADIKDEKMRAALVSYAEAAPGECHPLFLGLCADVVIAAQAAGKPLAPEEFADRPEMKRRGEALLSRLLRYVDKEVAFAVEALSACRAFDREIYSHLGATLNFRATEPAFLALVEFSFVWRAEQKAEGWYRIHNLLTRVIRDEDSKTAAATDVALENLYRNRAEQGDISATAEAIYHATKIEPSRGAKEWVETFEEELGLGRFELCRALLEVRTEMEVSKTDQAALSAAAGRFYLPFSRHEEAQHEVESAIAVIRESRGSGEGNPQDYLTEGKASGILGALFINLSRYAETEEALRGAISSYDEALRLSPDFVNAHNGKGRTQSSLGYLFTDLSRHTEAEEALRGAISSYDEALRLSPDLVSAHIGKGLAQARLGDLFTQISRHAEAEEALRGAVSSCDEALRLSPEFVHAHNNKGMAQLCFGELFTELSRHAEAEKALRGAISSYDEALRLSPKFVAARSNKGIAQIRLGELFTQISRHAEAEEALRGAISSCDEALRLSAKFVAAHNNKGHAQTSFGELFTKLSRHAEAEEALRGAISSYDEALRQAPDDVEALRGQSKSYLAFARLRANQSDVSGARTNLDQATADIDRAIEIAPADAKSSELKTEIEELAAKIEGRPTG